MSNNDYTYDNKSLSAITTKGIDTPTVATDKLTIGNTSISSISHDLSSPSITELPSANAVFKLYKELRSALDRIDPNDNIFTDNTVVSLPIVNRYIADNDWTINNWEPTLDKRYTYTASNSGNMVNSISTTDFIFNRTGDYFICINVDVLDSGKLLVHDQDNNLIATATAPGDLMFLYKVDLPSISKIHISATDVYKNEIIAISTVDIFYATQRIKQFLSFYVPETLSKKLSFVNDDDLRIALQLFEEELGLNMYPEPNDMTIAVGHVNRSNVNAHGETPASIGAASKDHLHTPVSIGAADRDHNHTAASVGAADKDHTHTPASIGAAAIQHLHDPDECGAAPVYHEHSTYALKDSIKHLSNMYTLPMSVVSGTTHEEHPYIPASGFIDYKYPYIGSSELHHTSITNINQNSGYVYCNKIPVAGVLSNSVRIDTLDVCTFAKPTAVDPLIIGYKFIAPRPIVKYTLYRKLDAAGVIDTTVTVPKKIQLKMDNDVVHEQTLTWVNSSDGTNASSVFYLTGIADNAKSFELVISEQLDAAATSMCVKMKISYSHFTEYAQSYNVLGANTRAICSDIDGGMLQMRVPTLNKIYNQGADACYLKTGTTIYPYTDGTITNSSPYAPEYAYKRVGYPLFKNIPTLNEDPLTADANEAVTAYGTIRILPTDMKSGSNVLRLFNYPVNNYDVVKHKFSCKPTSAINISGIPNANLMGWRLYFRQKNNTVTDNNVPSAIKITYTRTSIKYTGYNGTNAVTIPTRDEFNYPIIDTALSTTGVLSYKGVIDHEITDYVTSDTSVLVNTMNGQYINGPVTDITAIKIDLINTRSGATSTDLYGLKLLFSDDFYDISNGMMYNKYNEVISNRLYLGQCRKDSKLFNSIYDASYSCYSVGAMNTTTVKINNIGTGRKLITIPNPYFTTDVTVTPKYASEMDVATLTLDIITDDDKYTSSKLPIFSVVDISCRDITISTTTTIDAVVITRNW